MAVELGQRLREERNRKGLNQQDFARLGGVSRNSQTEYETGKTPPNSDYLTALGMAGVDVAYVLTGRRPVGGLSAAEDDLVNWVRNLQAEDRAALMRIAETMSHASTTLHDEVEPFRHLPIR